LNVPSLLGTDASTLYAKNQYNLLELMMKDNIITIDWTDEVIAKTALTHDGKLCDAARLDPGTSKTAGKTAGAHAPKSVATTA
jgi:NAD(P) transhydrogenase subunit alpha